MPLKALKLLLCARRGALCVAPLCLVGALLTGCDSLDRIDRRAVAMMERQSLTLGGGAYHATPQVLAREQERRPGQADTAPQSLNPGPADIGYESAPEDRDVSASLDEYAVIDEANALELDLVEAFRLSQISAREFLNEEEEYMLAAIRLMIERHLWGPRFFNDTSVSVQGQFDGGIDTPLRIINELRATQRLPYGGEVEARFIWQATEQLRRSVADDYVQSTALVLSGSVPLLRGAGLAARENLIQAERDLVYAARDFERFRREFLVSIANDFFELVRQQDAIRNQERSIRSLEQSLEQTAAQVAAGKRDAFQERQFEQSVQQAQSVLINLRERYLVSLDRFKIRLGIPVETPVVIVPSELTIPEPAQTPTDASALAARYRLDLQNARDRIDDSRRAVANARNDLLPDLNLGGAVRLDTDEDERVGGFGLQQDEGFYNATVTFGLPLDREIERLRLRSATISLQRQERSYDQFRDNVILSARAARRNIDQQRFAITLAEGRIINNQLTIEQLRLKEGDPFDLTRAEDSLLEAENARDQAIQSLRSAVLEYLLATGQMRLSPEGVYEPLEGMEGAQIRRVTGP